MMVLIRETVGGESVRGFLPLFQEASGKWYAITTRVVPTAEEAVTECVGHLWSNMRSLAADISDAVEHLERISRGLERLRDSPKDFDRVFLREQECVIADDGSTVLPPWPDEKSGPWSMPGLPDDVQVDDALLGTVRRASGEHDMSPERVLEMVASMIQDEPEELLLAVGEVAPEQLGRAAELVVAVSQARGERSVWAREREERERARGEAASVARDGVVQRAIDDEAPTSESARSEVVEQDVEETGNPDEEKGS